MISILGCSWLPLPPCLPSFVCLVSLHLSPFMISILVCSWLPLPLPPCLPAFVSLHDLHSGLLLAAAAALSPCVCLPSGSPFWAALGSRLVFQACLPSRSPFWAALGRRCRLASLHDRICLVPFLFCFFWQFGCVDAIWGLCRCN